MTACAGPHAPHVQQFHSANAPFPAAAGSAQAYAAPAQHFPAQPVRQPSPQPQQLVDVFPGFPQLPGSQQPSTAAAAALRAALTRQQPTGNAAPRQPPASIVSEDDYWADLEPEELPLKTVDRRKLDFDSDRLKVHSLLPFASLCMHVSFGFPQLTFLQVWCVARCRYREDSSPTLLCMSASVGVLCVHTHSSFDA